MFFDSNWGVLRPRNWLVMITCAPHVSYMCWTHAFSLKSNFRGLATEISKCYFMLKTCVWHMYDTCGACETITNQFLDHKNPPFRIKEHENWSKYARFILKTGFFGTPCIIQRGPHKKFQQNWITHVETSHVNYLKELCALQFLNCFDLLSSKEGLTRSFSKIELPV